MTNDREIFGKESESNSDEDTTQNKVLPSGDELAGRLIGDAQATVTGDRDTHGDAVKNQEHIAEAWTWYLRGLGALDEDEVITGSDVGRMMALLKMSRTAVGTYDVDHDRDGAGYFGIAAACEVVRGEAAEAELVEHE